MVHRPLSKSASTGMVDFSKGTPPTSTRPSGQPKRPVGPRRGLEWSLRSMHKIDTSAQFFQTNYYGDDDESDNGSDLEEDHTAYEIFKTKDHKSGSNDANGKSNGDSVWASLNAPLRTGVVDGKKVVFELKSNVTQKPTIPRKVRLKMRNDVINSTKSGLEIRFRFWLMRFTVGSLSCAFLAAFVFMNVLFASFFYALDERCCGEHDMSFGDVFAFCVQTSATIGYGVFAPVGMMSNFLVLLLTYWSIMMNTLFAGLLFTKYITPVINIEFSDVLTICNINGVPCLSFRLGNADGHANPLTDINVRLTYSYEIPYADHKGENKYFRQTEELQLLSNRQHGLLEIWTLRHVLDETSPLFGMNFEEHPANKIYVFTLSIDAVQELTKSTVNIQTVYGLQDVLIGHSFVNTESVNGPDHYSSTKSISMATVNSTKAPDVVANRWITSDYGKISDTEPYPVWYPAKAGAYDTGDLIPTKSDTFHG